MTQAADLFYEIHHYTRIRVIPASDPQVEGREYIAVLGGLAFLELEFGKETIDEYRLQNEQSSQTERNGLC